MRRRTTIKSPPALTRAPINNSVDESLPVFGNVLTLSARAATVSVELVVATVVVVGVAVVVVVCCGVPLTATDETESPTALTALIVME